MVDEFLNQGDNRTKWTKYISTPPHHLGEMTDVVFSFRHPLVSAHFKFALYILDILADLNTIFQRKYSFVNYFWEYLVVLHEFFVRELGKIEARDFGKFEYLSLVREEDRPQFVTIMKHLILNLQVRFYQPSFPLTSGLLKSIWTTTMYQSVHRHRMLTSQDVVCFHSSSS